MNDWIDTHAHIYTTAFAADRHDTIERAILAGVSAIFMPNIDHTSIDDMLDTEWRNPSCKPMMGLHPCSVKKDFQRELYLVENWLTKRKFSAIGEIGTDLYWDKTFWPEQQEAFKIQVEWAKRFRLPLAIHCRESIAETIELLTPFVGEGLTGIFHCFSGTTEQLKKIIEMGFYVGIGGVATFKNGGLEKVLPELDLSRLVLETDSPYLAPVPHRGKRNEPAYIPIIAQRISAICNIKLDELSDITTRNARLLFSEENSLLIE